MAPTPSSSLSTTTSKSSQDSIKKKFSCMFPACGKSFSRSEHLHRHALNHKDGNNTCRRCSAHFRRRDLLDRHMTRHQEKDTEAGGEGLGILATRKRLWRDETGKIVNARRPSYVAENGSGSGSGSGKRRQIRKASNSSSEDRSPVKNPPPTRTKGRRGHGSTTGETIVVDTGAGKSKAGQNRYPRIHLESDIAQDSWLAMTALPLASHQLSPSSSPGQDADADPEPDLDTLYDDFYPSLSPHSHSSLSNTSHSSPTSQSTIYPPPSWGPSHSPFQTFMGAVSSSPSDLSPSSADLTPPLSPTLQNHNHTNPPYQYTYPPPPPFFKSSLQSHSHHHSTPSSILDFDQPTTSQGRNLYEYEWTPQHWSGGSGGNLSRCREEKWDPRESLTLPALGMIAEAGFGVQEGLKRGWSVVR